MPRLLMAMMVVAGLAFACFAGEASRTSNIWSFTSAALYAVAGACFLLAASLGRKRRGD